ncbi:MAG: hypothetical protein Pg6B_10780 [Candidatus Azobacteroides pseudotrichonymphae]|nr:MAG: hypothetical protein Pg6B_10780 [Candidatus Azobacteroides pseudotrichonymphae]
MKLLRNQYGIVYRQILGKVYDLLLPNDNSIIIMFSCI